MVVVVVVVVVLHWRAGSTTGSEEQFITSWFTVIVPRTSLAGWFYHLTVVLVFTNSCINPFIYAAKYREFQHGVRRLASCINKQPGQIQSLEGTSSVHQAANVATQPPTEHN